MLTKKPSAITAEGFFIGSFYNGSKIEYTYDVVGTRLCKKITQVSVVTKNYAGLFEYNNSNLLKSMHTPEGRCVTIGSSPEFGFWNGRNYWLLNAIDDYNRQLLVIQ